MAPHQPLSQQLSASQPSSTEPSRDLPEEVDSRPARVGADRIDARLGSGGMGEVYRAFDERLLRPVALKRIRAEVAADSRARRRFEREARAAARLRHSGVVELHDLFRDGEGDWIVMELVEGRPLAEVLRQDGLPPFRVLEVAADLADALGCAHSAGIVHRDLKTKNVMLTPEGRAKILDFGLARWVRHREGAQSATITAVGQVVGTPHAMSPEQALGRKVDLRSDLFSLGSMLYEMATGVSPFAAASVTAVLNRICAHLPPPIHELTPAFPLAFSELVGQLLEKNPTHRPASAAEVASRLRGMADRWGEGRTWEQDPESPGPARNDATAAALSEPMAERRQLTVLECLLVFEQTEREAGTDPAALARVADGLEALAREVILGLDGHVARCEGHRLEARFGYPRAQEDAARRAVHAGRELLSRIGSLDSGTAGGSGPSLHIGVHTGPAVVSSTGHIPPILGRTSDVAEDLARAAGPNEILVSETVRRLVADAYAVEESGQSLADTEAFRIGGDPGKSGSSFSTTPLVARRTEIDLLVDRASRVREGVGQVALIHGEAGIGKSRLLAALKDELEEDAMGWLLAQASPVHRASPLQPVIHLLSHLIEEATGNDGEPDPLAALERIVGEGAPASTPPLLAALLGLPIEGRHELPDVTPQKQREMTLQALVELMTSFAEDVL
ncbi:MAG: protein kinase, partial [Holophagales bacterium]|nr:protein kinase [Holophagales bacterium]